MRPPRAEELIAELRDALASPQYRPPVLPAVALEVMSLSRQPDVDLGEVVRVLERDPVLAARLLALVPSARFVSRSPVVTVKQAAVRLGLQALLHLVLQAALELRLFRAPGYEWLAERANRHACAVAQVTRDVCLRAGAPSEHAFITGLLHDIGLSSALLLVTEVPAWRGLPLAIVSPALDAVHAEASALLARTWGLPEPLPTVLLTHHAVEVDGRPAPLNAALIVAEQLCWEAGAGIADAPGDASATAAALPVQPLDAIDATWPTVVTRAVEVLQLDARALGAARVQAFGVVASLDSEG